MASNDDLSVNRINSSPLPQLPPPLHPLLAGDGGLVAEPEVPGGVVADVHALLLGLPLEGDLELVQEGAVHELEIVREVAVEDAVDELHVLQGGVAVEEIFRDFEGHRIFPFRFRQQLFLKIHQGETKTLLLIDQKLT